MDSTREQTAIRREIAIAARPETVWGLLTDPEKALGWWGIAMSLDVRPEGAYRIEVTPGNIASGVFVEIDAPTRLVYTWGWEQRGDTPNAVPPGSSTVEIDLVETDEGTLLRLTHRGLPEGDRAASHGTGWDHYLARLATRASGRDPGRDPWISDAG
jgi:uncharacterized protein YndB with AHSA1/START domain